MLFIRAGEFIINKLLFELPEYLTYHNAGHVVDVYNAAENIGKQEKIGKYEMRLLLTAAWYHDAGFLELTSGHEKVSCRIAQEVLSRHDYNHVEIERICGMIMATRVPQSPKNHLEQILADADLDYLGRDDFFEINNKLFTELSYLGVVTNEQDWYKVNIDFMENHHYFTQTSVNLRKAKKEANLTQIKSQLK